MVTSTFDTEWDPKSQLPTEIRQLLNNVQSSYSYITAFQQMINLLKTQKRTGWLNHDITEPESIADHMYRMSLIAMSLNADNFPNPVNLDKCCKIALVHDLAELLVGDIVPHDPVVDKLEKGKREYKLMLFLLDIVKHYNEKFSQELCELWLDYEEQRNYEAKIVKDIDKYELLLSLFQYEQRYKGGKNLEEFFRARELIKTDEIATMADELLQQRQHFWTSL